MFLARCRGKKKTVATVQHIIDIYYAHILWNQKINAFSKALINLQQNNNLNMYPLVNQHNYGKSPFLIGKSTIKGPCSIANCQFTGRIVAYRCNKQRLPTCHLGYFAQSKKPDVRLLGIYIIYTSISLNTWIILINKYIYIYYYTYIYYIVIQLYT